MKYANRKSQHLENLYDMEEGFTFAHARAEAERCLLCHEAPCSQACPSGTDPGTFIRKLRLRNVKGAIRTIRTSNILGGCCGVLCPTDQLCEGACSATEIDRPIQIGKLQRFLVEHSWELGFDPLIPGKSMTKKDDKVAVIGSGPAGLSCASEVARKGYQVTVYEGRDKPGGVLRYGVPQFRLNAEFLDRELEDIKKLGVSFQCGRRIEKDGADNLLNQGYDAVFIAPGIWQPYRQNIPGDDLKGVITATDFLEKARSGNEKELTDIIKGNNIAVTGGGSVAMDAANTCAVMGANRVYVIYRRGLEQMPADTNDVEMARANYVVIRPFSVIKEIIDENGVLTGLKGIETDWKEPGKTTSDNLMEVPGTEFNLNVDMLIMAIGSGPEQRNVGLAGGIEHLKGGLIKVGDDGISTDNEKIFAGGDIIRGSGLVVDAIQDGKKAAWKIIEYLEKEGGD